MNNSEMAAYPLQLQEGETSEGITKHGPADGLTKREYFAGLAMQGLLGEDVNHGYNARTVAKWSVEQADALLSALENTDER